MRVFRMNVCFIVVVLSARMLAQAAPQEPPSKEIRFEEMKVQTLQGQRELEDSKTKLVKSRELFAVSGANTVSPLTSLQATIKGTFWRNSKWIELLALSADQQSKMDEIFQQYRLRLIDLTASLQKEELILEPLMGNAKPAPGTEPKILTQIDRIADARAELEKANSRMLVSILQVLTAEQWSKLPIAAFTNIKPVKKSPGKF
jgi:hypothetical protein